MGAKPEVAEVLATCNRMNKKIPHPTQNPEELVRKFLFASSRVGDIVLDPFSSSGTTVVVAAQFGRHFLVCKLDACYNGWAVNDCVRSCIKPRRNGPNTIRLLSNAEIYLVNVLRRIREIG